MTRQESLGFERLHKKIQKWIWDKGWQELRDIQEESILHLLTGDNDLIISSSTASGKTEAAYLPVCSYLLNNPGPGIRVLYISPLKALIDDQYERLEQLCENCDIPVHRWHGDITQEKKKKIHKNPEGLLLITPESLEALFVRNGPKILTLFNNLSFVIVDELHSFFDNERGKQLQSLLCRLEMTIKKKIPRIGLSATIGDMGIASEFLRANNGNSVKILESKRGEHELRLQIRGYKVKNCNMDNQEKQSEERIADHIFETLRGSNNLIFANKKSDVEVYADKLRTISERQKLPNEFFPHHGSLSKEIRQDVEKRLKDKHLPTNVICTSTLEMGIDIGDVKSVAQLDCPPSVSSMKQRIGRSGRRDTDPSILRIYIQESEITKSSHCGDMMREDLFQSVAMTELLLKKWVEPPDGNILHLSTLIQQILSVIAQYGGIKAENCWKLLCQNGPFGKIGPNKFAELLRNLGKHEIIMQTHEGLLLLGIKGERIVNHYQFYAAFVTNDEYRLITEGKTLGTIPISYPVIKDMYIIFAGRRWIVIDVNEEQKVIILQPSPGGIPPKFSNSGALIHDEIRNKMFQLYSSEYIPVYLNEEARKLFMEGRDNFRRLKLDIFNLIKMGPNTLLFPWVGDKSINTLGVLLMSKGLKVSQAGFLLEILNITPADLLPYLEEISQRDSIDLIGLASIVKCKNQEKYDHFLTENLLCAEYAARNLNIESAQKCAASIFEKGI